MTPILWSFRRCPYAIRARLALDVAGISVEHREIVLRAKPDAFLNDNPAGTVPVLVHPDHTLIHSRDIMIWALNQHDPEAWLDMPTSGYDLIDTIEGPFKFHLDRYKYASRHSDSDPLVERDTASQIVFDIEDMLPDQGWLFGTPTLADYAILPFIRQFAHTDVTWFNAQPWPRVQHWLQSFKESERFARVMTKHPLWQPAQQPG